MSSLLTGCLRSCISLTLVVCFQLTGQRALSADMKEFPRLTVANLEELIELLPPPPAAGCDKADADLKAVEKGQKEATDESIAAAKRTYRLNAFTFAPALGSTFTSKSYPETSELFHEVGQYTKHVVSKLKNHYRRPHPNRVQGSNVVRLVGGPDSNYCYPSGHTTKAYVFACLLSQLRPELRQQFYSIASGVADGRIIAGQHYPTDIAAGKLLAKELCQELLAYPPFEQKFAELKTSQEWSAGSPTETPR